MNLHAESRSRRSALGTEQRIAICTLVLALSSFLAGCGKSSANAPGAGPGAMPVQVRIATAAKIPETTEYLSILKSRDRKSTRLNSSHGYISYAVFCLKKKKILRLRQMPSRISVVKENLTYTS